MTTSTSGTNTATGTSIGTGLALGGDQQGTGTNGGFFAAEQQNNAATLAPYLGNQQQATETAAGTQETTKQSTNQKQQESDPVDELRQAIAAMQDTLSSIQSAKGNAAEQQLSTDIKMVPDDLHSVDLSQYENPVMQALGEAIAINAPAGFNFNKAVGEAMQSGDVNKLNITYFVDAFGKEAPAKLKLAQRLVEVVASEAKQAKQSIYDAVGGVDNWNNAVAAFNQNAPYPFRAAVATMINGGDPEIAKAGAQMVAAFAQNNNLVNKPGNTIQAGMQARGTSVALSKEQFIEEYQKIDFSRPDAQQQYEEICKRRALGQQSGV